MKLGVLAGAVEGAVVHGDATVEITGLTHDSRRVGPGFLFVALSGASFDGRIFVPAALEAGAAAVALPFPADGATSFDGGVGARCGEVPAVLLPRPRADLACLAAAFHGRPSRAMRIIGVTGTNGKTTVTTLIAAMCLSAGVPRGMIGTVAHSVGPTAEATAHTTPEAPDLQALLARMRDAGVPVVAMEVSSVGLAEHRVDAVEFEVAVFLNLSVDHLDYHGDLAAYGEAKLPLFTRGLRAGGVAVVNVDDAFGAGLLSRIPAGRPVWRLSTTSRSIAEVRYEDLVVDHDGIRGRLCTPAGSLVIDCPLLGRFNAVNIAAAAAAALAAGLPVGAVESGLIGARVPGRLEPVPNRREIEVLVDYAHSPDAIERVLEALRPVTPGSLWCVFGCAGDRDATKRRPMGEAAAAADAVVVTTDNPRSEDPARIAAEVADGAVAAGRAGVSEPAVGGTWVELNRRTAIRAAVAAARPGDTVLIAGKGHERYQEIGDRRLPFDDVAEARAALDDLERDA